LQNSALSETFSNKASGPLPTYKTDKGRKVVGGGGIEPDIRVSPHERTRLEAVLDGSGAITSFATQYLASHSPLPANFEVTPDLIDEFKVFLSARNIQPDVAEWTGERTWVSHRLQEEIITQARGVDQGDEIEAQWDPQVQAALSAVRSDDALAANIAAQ
jgi:carboxyl-terminal processing protease